MEAKARSQHTIRIEASLDGSEAYHLRSAIREYALRNPKAPLTELDTALGQLCVGASDLITQRK